MKTLLFFSIIIFLNTSIYSQVYAPDFTMTDTQGNTYNLYDECDQGKTIVLDFFHRSCGSCQTNTPRLDSIWQYYGGNGDSVWVWGIEGVIGPINGTNAEIDTFKATYGSTFPCFSTYYEDTILYLYDIYYTPQYYVVCPNKQMKYVIADNIQGYVEICLNAVSSDEIEKNKACIKSIYTNNNIVISYFTGNNSDISFDIYDIYGKKAHTLKLNSSDGFHKTSINKSKFNIGLYIIRMIEGDKIIDVKRFVVF